MKKFSGSTRPFWLAIGWFVTLASLGTTAINHTDGNYPARTFSERQRVDGGYRMRYPIDRASVIFPVEGWKLVDVTFPGGGYVVEPVTGTSFRYFSIRFGRKPQQFLFWAWSAPEHRWAERWKNTSLSLDRQNEFLGEWLNRALVKGEIGNPDDLSVVIPVLSADLTKAQLCPLRLADQGRAIAIQTEQIDGHTFSHAKMATYALLQSQRRHFDSEVWISYFRYIPKFEQWQLFVAFSHIPNDLNPEQKKNMRELFMKTLRTLSLEPFSG